jgi:hypothetical protein
LPGTFAQELKQAEEESKANAGRRPSFPRPAPIEDEKLRSAGLRKLEGKHLVLLTDLPASPAVDELPAVFDQALPQWCDYFGVDRDEQPVWKMRGFLLKDAETRKRLRKLDLMPPEVPDFENGYTFNHEFWFFEQRSDYYRRHLMLHEGTHGFMLTHFGLSKSPWYFEATAELFGTHAWDGKKLTLRHFPRSREETSYHGRIKLVKEAFAERKAFTLDRIVGASMDLHRDEAEKSTIGYAWCWASAVFLDGHSRYKDRFRSLYKLMRVAGLAGEFNKLYASDQAELYEEWQVFIAGLEYGYDISRTEIEFLPGTPLPASGATVTLKADRGWQSSQIRLEAGKAYQIAANGRYVVAQQPKPWECEPGGVSLRYYRGLPLGILLAAVRIEKPERDRLASEKPEALNVSPFLLPHVVGKSAKITPQHSGTLYLKINDSAAELADNSGSLEVRVTAGN